MFASPITHFPGLRAFLLLLICCVLGTTGARAQFGEAGKKYVTPSLIADTTAVKAGQPFTVGIRLRMEPGWHVYWQFPGDAGAAPTVEWVLPEGFKAGPIQWPLATSHLDEGGLLTYIYEGAVVLPVQITPPATLPPGDIAIKAKLKWLVCEKICIPGKGEADLTLPVGEAAPANEKTFSPWLALLPKTSAPTFQVKWDRTSADSFSVQLTGVPKDTIAEFFPLPPKGIKPGQPKIGDIAEDGTRTITFPIETGGTPNLPWRGVLATAKGDAARESWLLEAEPSAAAGKTAESANGAEAVPSGPTTAIPSSAPKKADSLILTLCLAFVGGLILNIMPCVLPVIAIKIFGFVNQAGQDPARVFRLGLAYTAGVYAFFLFLATVVVQLRGAFIWGAYLLGNGYLLSIVVVLVFIFSLNLIGVFEITLGSGTATKLDELSRKEGYGGAFMHGLFTTLLGTSCTAPYLAGSVSYATTQPAPIIYLIFLAVATGMALPYFLLTAKPAWLKFVPKPGIWMERVKQFLGFVMLGVAVWLFSVLANVGGTGVAGAMGWVLLFAGLGCWIIGTWTESILARLVFVAIIAAGYFVFLHPVLGQKRVRTGEKIVIKTGSISWENYSEERLASAIKEGSPVFIDFTADWCPNCKAYEKLVLSTEAVGAKFAEKKIVALRADLTDTSDPVVSNALKGYNRNGLPLYVIRRPGEEPVIADGLTIGWLIGELDKIK